MRGSCSPGSSRTATSRSFAADLPRLVGQSFDPTMRILRDADFQRLLTDYPRANPPFVVAPTVIDTVDSEWLIQAGVGREYKPDDYLQAFADVRA